MTPQYATPEGLDFTHLESELGFFPFSCWSGYYFFWNNNLTANAASEAQEEVEAETLLRKELSHLKKQNKKKVRK